MSIASAEQALCRIYLNSYNNQKKDVNETGKRNVFSDRLKNLNRQFPYDMSEIVKKYNLNID